MRRRFRYWWIRNLYPIFKSGKVIKINFAGTFHYKPGELILNSKGQYYESVGNDWFLIQ